MWWMNITFPNRSRWHATLEYRTQRPFLKYPFLPQRVDVRAIEEMNGTVDFLCVYVCTTTTTTTTRSSYGSRILDLVLYCRRRRRRGCFGEPTAGDDVDTVRDNNIIQKNETVAMQVILHWGGMKVYKRILVGIQIL